MRISALRITVTGFPRLADGSLTIGVLAAVQLESIISNLSSSIQVSTSAAACHWHAGLGRVGRLTCFVQPRPGETQELVIGGTTVLRVTKTSMPAASMALALALCRLQVAR